MVKKWIYKMWNKFIPISLIALCLSLIALCLIMFLFMIFVVTPVLVDTFMFAIEDWKRLLGYN